MLQLGGTSLAIVWTIAGIAAIRSGIGAAVRPIAWIGQGKNRPLVPLPGLVLDLEGGPWVVSTTDMTLDLVRRYFESVTVVSDADTVRAMNFILERLKVITEPAAACTVTAAEELRANFGPDSRVALVFCGGNTSAADLCGYQSLIA